MKPGIVILAELSGPVAERIHALQAEFDPRMAAELPPHVTIAGSSGMGPIAVGTTPEELREKLEPVVSEMAPFVVHFQPPHRFMQTNLVVLPIDPHGAIRELHDRIARSGLRYEQPRFTFTPHCTLNFYRELPAAELRRLMAVRVREPVTVDRIDCYRTVTLTRTERILELRLTAVTDDCGPGLGRG